MNDFKKDLKKLYNESLEKWESILGMIENHKHFVDIYKEIEQQCSFCKDARKENSQIWLDCSGEFQYNKDYDELFCTTYCKIDKKICGSKKSLIMKLYNSTYKKTEEKCLKSMKKIIVKMIKKIKINMVF